MEEPPPQPAASSETPATATTEMERSGRRQPDRLLKGFLALARAQSGWLEERDRVALDPFTNAVKVTIARLRRKLGQPDIIHTTPGVGYRITEAP